MKRWQLWPDKGFGSDRVIAVGFEPIFIGRAVDCDLRPNHPLVSRRHCMLNTDGERLFVRDAGSKHGTWVNGIRVTDVMELHSGDTIWVGLLPVVVQSAPIRSSAPGVTQSDEFPSLTDSDRFRAVF